MSRDPEQPPRLRAAEGRDAPILAELLGQLGYPAEVEAVKRRLEHHLSRSDGAVLVAEEDGRVVGVGALHLVPVLHEDAPRGMLTALVVAESARGRGVGKELVRGLEEIAMLDGVQSVVVTTANHREATHHFYERLGYAWTGRRYRKEISPTPARSSSA